MSTPVAATPLPPKRLLALSAALLVVAAVALWGSSRGTWVEQEIRGVGPAPRTSTLDGAGAEPILVPWALLCLAAVGGLVATSGWGRRVVGVLVAVAGGWAMLRGVVGLAAPATGALPVAVRPGDDPLPATAVVVWPLVAVLGGLAMLLAGLIAARYARVLPRLGARYDAPGVGAGPGSGGAVDRPADPDRALWEALDAGRDPTGEPITEPGREATHGPGAAPPATPPSAGPGGSTGDGRGRESVGGTG